MKKRIAINGFGRIGRASLKVIFENPEELELVAVNDLMSIENAKYLLKYDTVYGKYEKEVQLIDEALVIDNHKVVYLSEKDPEKLPWKAMGIDLVIESTGFFTDKEGSEKHIKAGAKKVIISAPGKGVDFTVVLGVNDDKYDPAIHNIISNGSCTTNCLAPVAKVLNDNFEIVNGLMTTIHSYTNDQRILDLPHSDLRRARAAGLSMIPTSTGAAKAISEVLPELKGKLNGLAIRVPTPTVSLVDLTVVVKKATTVDEVNTKMKEAAGNKMSGFLGYSDEPLVSIDYKKCPLSSILDALSTEVIGGTLVKILSWYDNEWGYSNRLVDLIKIVGDKM